MNDIKLPSFLVSVLVNSVPFNTLLICIQTVYIMGFTYVRISEDKKIPEKTNQSIYVGSLKRF